MAASARFRASMRQSAAERNEIMALTEEAHRLQAVRAERARRARLARQKIARYECVAASTAVVENVDGVYGHAFPGTDKRTGALVHLLLDRSFGGMRVPPSGVVPFSRLFIECGLVHEVPAKLTPWFPPFTHQ